jgi:hypothetical protein
MRILLDECVNPRLRLAFPGDEVKTVAEMGWRALTNGALMKEAASPFDVFVTLDQNLRFQNQIGKHPLGIVVLITQFNHVAAYHSLRRSAIWPGKRNPDRSTSFKSRSESVQSYARARRRRTTFVKSDKLNLV